MNSLQKFVLGWMKVARKTYPQEFGGWFSTHKCNISSLESSPRVKQLDPLSLLHCKSFFNFRLKLPEYKLLYFDLRAIAEPIRLIFAYGEIPYEDKRLTSEEWAALKPTTDMQKLPVLYVDNEELSQSSSISRYLAKKCGLIPSDDFDAARCDEVVDTLQDIINSAWRPFVLEQDKDEKGKRKQLLLEGPVPLYLSKFEKLVKLNGNNHIVGSKTSWADLALAHYLELWEFTLHPQLSSQYPALKALQQDVFQIPQIKEWIDKRPAMTMA